MYNKTNWKDHVVERPRTYMQSNNADGSKTFTPAPGEILQQGTPQSATNFNNIEEAIAYYSATTDWLITIVMAQQMEIETIKEALTAAQATGENEA